ncbi:MAG: hypothetical protein KDK62_08505 [Chlamydiia bacterium]|nr:hypothetical protein [Chlamydiia bacterium]
MEIQKWASLDGLTIKDFIPSFDWDYSPRQNVKFEEKKPAVSVDIVKDNRTGKYYLEPERGVWAFGKRVVTVIGHTILNTISLPFLIVCRLVNITFFCTIRVRTNTPPLDTWQKCFTAWKKECLLLAVAVPAFFALELSLAAYLLAPQEGSKLVNTWSNVLYGEISDLPLQFEVV